MSQSQHTGEGRSVKGAAANNPHSLEPWPHVGDERRASTLLEKGAISCIRAGFQASCRLQGRNCFIGCALTSFPAFLGDSKVKPFSLVKKGKLRVPAPMTQGSGALVYFMALFFYFFGWWIFLSLLRWQHTRGKLHWQEGGQSSQWPRVPVAKWDTSFSSPEVVQVIPTSDTSAEAFSMWESCQFWGLFWNQQELQKKNLPQSCRSTVFTTFCVNLWEPGDCASSTLENLKTFWQLKDGHKWLTLNVLELRYLKTQTPEKGVKNICF